MERINVSIKEREKSYEVLIGSSISSLMADFIKKRHKGRKIVIVTDDNLKKLCEKTALNALKSLNPLLITIPAGEKSKSRVIKEKIENELLDKKYGRDTIIIAFGGGVIGDLVGFTASTFDRGVPLIHIPTTLLAMVDSSIGGKTSVNTKHGKNLIGTTYQPDAVFADLDLLDKLPNDDLINGMAEVIKIAATSDKDLFEFIQKNNQKILNRDKATLMHIIKRSVEIKTDIIEKDEKEAGLRQILNFGHTVGHALESCKKYIAKHGQCVSVGLVVEAKIANLIGILGNRELEGITSVLNKFHLPMKVEKKISAKEMIEIMKMDKKARNQKPRFVILETIGKIKSEKNNFSFEVDEPIIKKAIEFYRK
jgi:3-dehydroquinate synthase